MDILIGMVLDNLKNIGFAVSLLAVFMLSNMAFSLWYNIKIVKEKFQIKKLIEGLFKIISFSIGLALLTIGITLIPTYITYIGIEIKQEVLDLINISVIVYMFIDTIVFYGKQASETLNKILKTNTSINNK